MVFGYEILRYAQYDKSGARGSRLCVMLSVAKHLYMLASHLGRLIAIYGDNLCRVACQAVHTPYKRCIQGQYMRITLPVIPVKPSTTSHAPPDANCPRITPKKNQRVER